MELSVQYVNFNPKEQLKSFLKLKTSKLERYYEGIVKVAVYLKAENTTGKQNKMVEIKVSLPHISFVVKKREHSFEAATMKTLTVLTRQLKQRKLKELSHKEKPNKELENQEMEYEELTD